MFSKLFGRKPGPATPLSPTDYADQYAAFVRERMPEVTVTRRGDNVHVAWSDGGTFDAFLGNAYTNYLNESDALPRIFEASFALLRTAPGQGSAFDPSTVLPVIRPQSWREVSLKQIGLDASSPNAPLVQPLVADLLVAYAQDLPERIDYVKPSDLSEEWDLSALRVKALANLTERAASLDIVGKDGRFRVELDGFFDTSLALIVPFWIDRISLRGDPVLALPSRDQLMVCGSEDVESIASLGEIAPEIAAQSSYSITKDLYVYRDRQLLRMI